MTHEEKVTEFLSKYPKYEIYKYKFLGTHGEKFLICMQNYVKIDENIADANKMLDRINEDPDNSDVDILSDEVNRLITQNKRILEESHTEISNIKNGVKDDNSQEILDILEGRK